MSAREVSSSSPPIPVKTHDFDVVAGSVEVTGDTAVASDRFTARYEVEGRVQDERGREPEKAEGWRAGWRTQLFLGAVTAPS